MNLIQVLIMLICGTIGGFIGALIVAKISVNKEAKGENK